ncbi:MAG: type II toxin-antitoxin system PemK/MazF family toxin [Sphingobacteriales bacterium]|nr:MAG: type II toxin-antitoxin system PemK/MazF family toxin [Sphingobacteriales bacterium]
MIKGDIIVVPFPFTNLTGTKLRPVVVLIESEYDLTVTFITTQIKWKEPTDLELFPTLTNGIKKPSLVRVSKISTIDKSLALGKLGTLKPTEIAELNKKLKSVLQLN